MGSQQQTSVLLQAHADLVTDAAYDYYGLRLATCGLDHKIKIWILDESTGSLTAEDEWRAHDAPIVKLSWAHPENGSVVASCSFDRTVKIWEERKHEAKLARWVNRSTLTEARGSVRSLEFAPQHFGLKLATLSTDMQLRIYECVDMPSLSNWTVVEEFDLSVLPSPVHTSSQGTPTLTGTHLDPSASSSMASAVPSNLNPNTVHPSGAAATPSPGTHTRQQAEHEPGVGDDGDGVPPAPMRDNLGSREADGGWSLSWCKDKWWGQIMAVACGTSNILKIIEFPTAQHPITHLELKHDAPVSKPSKGSSSHQQQHPAQPPAITSVAWAPSCGRSYHLVATGSRDCMVRIWKLKPPKRAGAEGEDGRWSGSLIADFNDHRASVGRVEWNVTGTILSSAGDDGQVRLFKQAYGSTWRGIGGFTTEQMDDSDDGIEERP
ncbi:hypothetical protein FRB93_010313 [Tulasnella sp. JGI-2019a]|nr:hypothetical protein FRB93_010313 [Tulasnella sp. JGI-2019a]